MPSVAGAGELQECSCKPFTSGTAPSMVTNVCAGPAADCWGGQLCKQSRGTRRRSRPLEQSRHHCDRYGSAERLRITQRTDTIAVSDKLSCNPHLTSRCSGPPYVLVSEAGRSAVHLFATKRRIPVIDTPVVCPLEQLDRAQKGVVLGVTAPYVRNGRVEVAASISCRGSRRDPNEGFFEGIRYHMEFVNGKWVIKDIVSHVIT